MAPLILPAITPECTVLAMLHAGLDLEAVHALKTCNCTVPVMAAGFADLLTGERQFKRFPRVTPIFAINGGAGAIFSRGLLQKVRVPHYERCVLGKGPPIFAKCLGELAGRLGSFFVVAFAVVMTFSVGIGWESGKVRRIAVAQVGASCCPAAGGDGVLTHCLWYQGKQ